MQVIEKNLSTSIPYQFLPDKSTDISQILFLDIETTGLSSDISSIYLIGCCYYQKNTWKLIQFFADDYISEKSMLEQFSGFAKNYKVIIHYNGTGFDIPYLQKKFLQYHMNFSLDSFLQIDLYKKLFPYKRLLNLENLKQKTVEQFFGLPRMDNFSGKELIKVYVDYMKNKFLHQTDLLQEKYKLLLHNEEDVTSLISLTSILAYSDLFEIPPAFCTAVYKDSHMEIMFSLSNSIKKPIHWQIPFLTLSASGTNALLSVDCIETELKYFYPNYKDYYYLPAEDTAIHKSIAEFVDKEYRVKAKAATCYTKKKGIFIPQFHGNIEPSFRSHYKDKQSYLELTDSFLSNPDTQIQYTSILLHYLIHTIHKR